MADIFLSYASQDRDIAEKVANLIESAGWSVWWDRHIGTGDNWRSMIGRELADMKCMVVLWSKNSIASNWVSDEADEARGTGRPVVPAVIQAIQPPLGWRNTQAVNLSAWDGSTNAPEAKQLIKGLEQHLGPVKKQIILCADGEWGPSSSSETLDYVSDPTNVFKLFLSLDGESTIELLADEREKLLMQRGLVCQVAKYLRGAGDSRNYIVRHLGQAFGGDMIARVVRGYTFISRNFEPGDELHLVGFSRGAYTARALAGLISSIGLLDKSLTVDKEAAYRSGTEAWYRYRKISLASNKKALAHVAEIALELPGFASSGLLKDRDLVPVDWIKTVAVWDTVGPKGIPIFASDRRRLDAFEFADTKLSNKVRRGFHAVALDEQRADFVPTLWEPADNVIQLLFPGAHSDVGGGYPIVNNESGLSDGALKWVMGRLAENGVRFLEMPQIPVWPDPAGVAHKPWEKPPFNGPTFLRRKREFPAGMAMHPSIQQRVTAGAVLAAPGEALAPYAPENLPGKPIKIASELVGPQYP